MIALLLAMSASCAASPASLLEQNRQAMQGGARSGTAIAHYDYEGQGLRGSVSTVIDLATGHFVVDAETPPLNDMQGFDGRTAWFRDLSGAFVPQGRNGRRAIAVSQAYINAQDWWKVDRGGARLELAGCNAIRVTPPAGNPFVATFDPATSLLAEIRQTVTFGVATETRFSDYQRRGGLTVPSRVDIFTNDDPGTRETMRLSSFEVAAAGPHERFAMPARRPGDWHIPSSGRTSVPFRLLNNHIVVAMMVNGKGPFPFVLDSGGHSILTPSAVRALGLASQGESASGGSGEKMVASGYARVDRLDLGGAALTNQTVMTLDFSPLAVEGVQLGGMIGLEFLERFVVRIDYGRRMITIVDPDKFDSAMRRRSGTPIPFTFYEHMPQIGGTLDGGPARFNIDTGSRSEVTMTSAYVARESLKSVYPAGVEATEGWGVGGPARAYLVRARSMKLGPVEVPRPVVGLSTAKKGAMSDSNYDGNVGSGALKRFVVTFDYRARMMYLAPAPRLDADTGHFDRTGMWLNLASDGLEVMDVAEGSPAAAAGLQVGDRVTAIGGRSVLGRALSDIRSSLKTAETGKTLRIAYLRDGRPATVDLLPRVLIPEPELSRRTHLR